MGLGIPKSRQGLRLHNAQQFLSFLRAKKENFQSRSTMPLRQNGGVSDSARKIFLTKFLRG